MTQVISIEDELVGLSQFAGDVSEEVRLDSPFNMPESFRFEVESNDKFVLEIRYLADAPSREEPTEQCSFENICRIWNGKFSHRIYRVEVKYSASLSNPESLVATIQRFICQFGEKRNPLKYQTLNRLLGQSKSQLSICNFSPNRDRIAPST